MKYAREKYGRRFFFFAIRLEEALQLPGGLLSHRKWVTQRLFASLFAYLFVPYGIVILYVYIDQVNSYDDEFNKMFNSLFLYNFSCSYIWFIIIIIIIIIIIMKKKKNIKNDTNREREREKRGSGLKKRVKFLFSFSFLSLPYIHSYYLIRYSKSEESCPL